MRAGEKILAYSLLKLYFRFVKDFFLLEHKKTRRHVHTLQRNDNGETSVFQVYSIVSFFFFLNVNNVIFNGS